MSDLRMGFRKLCRRGVVPMPGAFNALCARAIERAGFEAVYVSGAGMSNAVYGLPDVGLTTLSECAVHVRAIAGAVRVPVLVDADTGFGEAINAARTVTELQSAGAAGMHLEDQILPKKCGHLDGKEVVPVDAMVEKIRAAVAARGDPEFVILARTDAAAVEGLDAAIQRGREYLNAGADGLFPEAMTSADDFRRFARAFEHAQTVGGERPILLANMTEFGKSPLLPLSELAEMGYRIVIYPQTALRVAFGAIEHLLADLRRDGSQAGWLERMQTRKELYDLLDYDGLAAIDRAATGGAASG
ncbi:MAG: methylisocitrate lyase [Phycisphaerae bacterium]|nr:methylisocitrate lyase [Phycisphaerae bacterium]NUQ46395.1 methylisocitrate lyase [Phycisphaerae bacterium]